MDLAKFGDSLLFCSSAIASIFLVVVKGTDKTLEQEKVPAKTNVNSNGCYSASCVKAVRVLEF